MTCTVGQCMNARPFDWFFKQFNHHNIFFFLLKPHAFTVTLHDDLFLCHDFLPHWPIHYTVHGTTGTAHSHGAGVAHVDPYGHMLQPNHNIYCVSVSASQFINLCAPLFHPTLLAMCVCIYLSDTHKLKIMNIHYRKGNWT